MPSRCLRPHGSLLYRPSRAVPTPAVQRLPTSPATTMIRLDATEIRALDALQDALDAGGDTIDDVLKLAHAGFGARPFAELARLYVGPLTVWQAEELAEHLGELLDTVDAWLDEGARAHLDAAIPTLLDPLLRTLRALEHRLDAATDG